MATPSERCDQRLWIGRLHQRLTDEEPAGAGSAQPGNVGSVAHTALANGEDLWGNLWKQVLADGEVGFQRTQVPVVDAE